MKDGWTAQLSDISSGATCVADLDSLALALNKEASGNSRGMQKFTDFSQTLKTIFLKVQMPDLTDYSHRDHCRTDSLYVMRVRTISWHRFMTCLLQPLPKPGMPWVSHNYQLNGVQMTVCL